MSGGGSIPWELLDSTPVPGTESVMSLHRRGNVFSMRVGGAELMNNWLYGIDCGLADQGCLALAGREPVRVLIGGLGMGFTLARTLSHLGPESQVVVAELVPAVVRWNATLLGELAGHPLRDPRVSVVEDDVGRLLRRERGGFDAILLDVDNGPEGLSRKGNGKLYARSGLEAVRAALRRDGVLAVWSLSGDRAFGDRMRRAAFTVEEQRIKQRGGRARQTIFVARPSARPSGGSSARPGPGRARAADPRHPRGAPP